MQKVFHTSSQAQHLYCLKLFVCSLGMLTSLDRDESQNFFSCSSINLNYRRNCLWSFEFSRGWPVASARPLTSQLQASFCAVGHLNFSSTAELFTRPLSHTVTPLRCWTCFTVLHLVMATPVAASVYCSDTGGWRFGLVVTRWLRST